MRTQIVGAATAALFLCPIPALAGGSDSPTPTLVERPEFDWNWQYAAPTCDGFTVTYPAFMPEGNNNLDVNVEVKNLVTGEFVTFNFHNSDRIVTGQTITFDVTSHPKWPGWEFYSFVWTQVHSTNYHWKGSVVCGQEPSLDPEPTEPTDPEPAQPTDDPTSEPEEPTEEPTPEPTEEPTEEPAPNPDPEPEEPTEEPAPEPEPQPTPDPEPTDEPEPQPEPDPTPERPEKPAPQWYGDKSYDCESGLVTVIDYRADWVWDDGEWVLGDFEYVSETTGPIDQPICDDSSEEPVDEGVGTPIVVDRPQSVDPGESPSPSAPAPDDQGDDPKPAPSPSGAVDRVELAETGAEDKLVAAAALLFLGGLALLTFRGRK